MHVKDLNSLNGTFVDHNNIDEAVVPTGSLLTVGGFTFRVDYNDAGAGTDAGDAESSNSGDELAAAFEKLTGKTASTASIESTDAVKQEAELNLGSLMDLAESDEKTPSEVSDLDTAELEVPQVEDDSPEEPVPSVQNVEDEIDLNAMFTEKVDVEAPAPEPVTEPPAMDPEAVDESPVPSPAEEEEEEVLNLAELDEDTSELMNTPPAEEVPQSLPEELEIVDPEQQGPPATDGDDDDLNSFLNNFK
jgi:hypothetical protein